MQSSSPALGLTWLQSGQQETEPVIVAETRPLECEWVQAFYFRTGNMRLVASSCSKSVSHENRKTEAPPTVAWFSGIDALSAEVFFSFTLWKTKSSPTAKAVFLTEQLVNFQAFYMLRTSKRKKVLLLALQSWFCVHKDSSGTIQHN